VGFYGLELVKIANRRHTHMRFVNNKLIYNRNVIKQWYNYDKFESKLEALWAMFLASLNEFYEYEPEGYSIGNGKYYLPDFRLPYLNLCIEVKPFEFPTNKFYREYLDFHIRTNMALLLVNGKPGLTYRPNYKLYCTISNEKYAGVYVLDVDLLINKNNELAIVYYDKNIEKVLTSVYTSSKFDIQNERVLMISPSEVGKTYFWNEINILGKSLKSVKFNKKEQFDFNLNINDIVKKRI
jgi:hypothetical protein